MPFEAFKMALAVGFEPTTLRLQVFLRLLEGLDYLILLARLTDFRAWALPLFVREYDLAV
jgi:hypothetical protein